jgi:hypothetical protein
MNLTAVIREHIEARLPFRPTFEQREQIKKAVDGLEARGYFRQLRGGHNWSTDERKLVADAVSRGMSVGLIANSLLRSALSIEAEIERQRLSPYASNSGVNACPPEQEAPTPVPGRHHRDVIIAWANGKDVQFSYNGVDWADTATPSFSPACFYRVKPSELPSQKELAMALVDVSMDKKLPIGLVERIRDVTETLESPPAPNPVPEESPS